MITTLVIFSSYIFFHRWAYLKLSNKEFKRLKSRNEDLTKLQRRFDRAIEAEIAILHMFEDGDPYAYELYKISLEEREAIELELKRLDIYLATQE